jgi:hypothetical protein
MKDCQRVGLEIWLTLLEMLRMGLQEGIDNIKKELGYEEENKK